MLSRFEFFIKSYSNPNNVIKSISYSKYPKLFLLSVPTSHLTVIFLNIIIDNNNLIVLTQFMFLQWHFRLNLINFKHKVKIVIIRL